MQQYDKMIQKLINFDDATKENITEHNPNQPQTFDHPYRILTIAGSGSGKTNPLFNLINHQPDLIKFIYMLKIQVKKNINF